MSDNPSAPGKDVGPNKSNLKAGDIEWIKPPKGVTAATSADDGPRATLKVDTSRMSPGQKKALARKLRKKLGKSKGEGK